MTSLKTSMESCDFSIEDFPLNSNSKEVVRLRTSSAMPGRERELQNSLFFLLAFAIISSNLASSSPLACPSCPIKAGYWPSWRAETFPPSQLSLSLFSHVLYAFLQPNSTTFQLIITEFDDKWMRNLTSTIRSKKPQVKTMLSIGGGGSDSLTFSAIAKTQSSRDSFIKSTIFVARNYDFDGVDLDWEFPRNQEDMANLASLFQQWRMALEVESQATKKPRLHLSSAVYFASNFFLRDPSVAYPADAIKRFLDFVSPMCFDYRGSWDTSATGAPALLYDKKSNISTSYGLTSWIAAGVPPEKIVMGLPLYGRTWTLKYPNETGIGAPAIGVGPGQGGVLVYSEIVDYNSINGATVIFDNETVSTYSFSGTNWIGYDGPTSTKIKVKFAKAHGLRGYFFWALGYDKDWTISKSAKSAWDEED